jgi:hypothetical protein
MFMIDLSFHLCLEQKKPDDCIVNIPILKNAKLAKPFCITKLPDLMMEESHIIYYQLTSETSSRCMEIQMFSNKN